MARRRYFAPARTPGNVKIILNSKHAGLHGHSNLSQLPVFALRCGTPGAVSNIAKVSIYAVVRQKVRGILTSWVCFPLSCSATKCRMLMAGDVMSALGTL